MPTETKTTQNINMNPIKNLQTDFIDYEKCQKRIQKAETHKTKWRDYFEECYDYFIPQRNSFQEEPGQKKDTKVYDSTALDAISDYANRMEQALVPPGREWVKLLPGSEIPEDQREEVQKYLQKVTKTLFKEINSSNFSSQINECFLDLGISTGAIIVEPGDGIQSNLHFRSVPLSDIILERSSLGIVENVFRRIELPAYDILETFDLSIEDLLPIAPELCRIIQEKETEDISLIEGVIKLEYPQDDGLQYIEFVMYEKEKLFLKKKKISSNPWIVFRENTTPQEVYGRGRAMRCLSDVKTLNKAMQYYIETVELIGNPIYTAMDDGILNPSTLEIRPKTIIPVDTQGAIQPLPIAGKPELNIDLIQRLQDSVRRTLMSKPFGQIDDSPVRTATEMIIRNNDLNNTSLAASGRIQTELIERIVKRCLDILRVQGKIPEMRIDGKQVQIKITSPSAKQQDENDLGATLKFFEILSALPPEIVQEQVKIEELPRYISEVMDIDPNLMRTKAEQEMVKQQRQQEMQQLAQLQAQQAQSQG